MRPPLPTLPNFTILITSSTIPNWSSVWQPCRKVEITVRRLCCWSRDCARCRRRRGSRASNWPRGWPNMRVLSLSCRNSMSISCPISWIGSILRSPSKHHNLTCSIKHNRLLPFLLVVYRASTFQPSQCVPSMSVNPNTRNTYTNNRNSRETPMWWAEVGWTEVFPAITTPQL